MLLVAVAMDRYPDGSKPDYTIFSHPPAYIRCFSIQSLIGRHIQKWKTEQSLLGPDNWDELALLIRARIEMAICEIGLTTHDPSKHERWMDVIVEHDTELLKRWAKILPDLQKSKLGQHRLAGAQLDPE